MDIKPGDYALVEHWAGPVVRVNAVGPKIITCGRQRLPVGVVRGVFASEAEADAALARYRQARRDREDEVSAAQKAARDADRTLTETYARVKRECYALALLQPVEEGVEG